MRKNNFEKMPSLEKVLLTILTYFKIYEAYAIYRKIIIFYS
jgi:hypothetical protein